MDGGLAHKRVQQYTDLDPQKPIPQESEITAGCVIEPGRSYGFFTDTTLCIGCKACEVACKEWNGLPAEIGPMTGHSYDNTGELNASTWRHVTFKEKVADATAMPPYQSNWLMMSDVCKHCSPAPCLEACPTGALFRTEFDTVVVQQDICNGCGYCVPACPFGVVELAKEDGKAHKCTLCYDRLKGGLEPACAKSCPTDSIQFGELGDLIARAEMRVEQLHEQGQPKAYLYGTPDAPGTGPGLDRLNAFFLLTEQPEVYNLPPRPKRPGRNSAPSFLTGLATMAGLAVAAVMIGVGRR
ncbi:4Fe-4S dicluster domain-containing protein [Falsiroseomonas sp.]|uniref:4Fe-4S dicluster domain-containing protein n=1 Tax=Falsiroseomonas sp. TaxID=2870721 RepID=UPI0027273612|nr:4Fe-4S dicluster domain-containing protein [Falsiroseomonas sp.]MDO9502867.1 4Fe-4S dicluster domain-containing protein [Falsiroseomonas sp.]